MSECAAMYACDVEYCTEAQGEVPSKGARRKPRAFKFEGDNGCKKGDSTEGRGPAFEDRAYN